MRRMEKGVEPTKIESSISAGIMEDVLKRNANIIKHLRTGIGDLTIAERVDKFDNNDFCLWCGGRFYRFSGSVDIRKSD